MSFDSNAQTSVTFAYIQSQNLNSALFGGLVTWGLSVFVHAVWLWEENKGKPLYILNMIQTALNLIKITTATTFIVFFGLNCNLRAPMIIMPQEICWIIIYCMLLIKLLIFTRFKKFAKGVFSLCLMVHFALVVTGVVMSVSTSLQGKCRNRYPLIFKQQYTVEMLLELVTFALLIHGLAYKKDGMLAGTRDILTQLKNNEHLRIFLVSFFITFKIILTYQPITAFDALSLTHGIDSARSALVHWALQREQKKIREAATRARKASQSYQPQTNIKASCAEASYAEEIDDVQEVVEHKDNIDRSASTITH